MELGRILETFLLLGTAVWAGELLTVLVVVLSSRGTIGAASRVAFFRDFGRRFTTLFAATGVIVFASLVALLVVAPRPLVVADLVLGACLVVVTTVGILQARRMTRLRHAQAVAGTESSAGTGSSTGPESSTVQRNAAVAAVLRSALVLGYLAMLTLAILLLASGGRP
jgi:hypothetical protein